VDASSRPCVKVGFLAPSPLSEAALARFAERKARGVGALFTITKKSILAAAGSGMKAPQVLETLQRVSAKPVPANVARAKTELLRKLHGLGIFTDRPAPGR
jgi:hypothetical protein